MMITLDSARSAWSPERTHELVVGNNCQKWLLHMVIYGYIRLENTVIIYGLLYVIVGSKGGLICFDHQANGEIQVTNRNSGHFL